MYWMEICVRGYLFTPQRNADALVSVNYCSVIEMHTFLVTLIRQFEFALPDAAPPVKRWRPGFLIPIVEGEEHRGQQLPLKVTPLKDV